MIVNEGDVDKRRANYDEESYGGEEAVEIRSERRRAGAILDESNKFQYSKDSNCSFAAFDG